MRWRTVAAGGLARVLDHKVREAARFGRDCLHICGRTRTEWGVGTLVDGVDVGVEVLRIDRCSRPTRICPLAQVWRQGSKRIEAIPLPKPNLHTHPSQVRTGRHVDSLTWPDSSSLLLAVLSLSCKCVCASRCGEWRSSNEQPSLPLVLHLFFLLNSYAAFGAAPNVTSSSWDHERLYKP